MPRDWPLLGSRRLQDARVFALRADRSRHPVTGVERDVYVIESPDWVNVIALTERDDVVLIEQFRHGTRRVTLEIPGGMLEPGEDPVTAGLRELREETGFAGGEATLLGHCEPNPAIQDNRCFFVLARGVARVAEASLDEGEDIDVRLAPLRDVPRLLEDGSIRHALVHAAFGAFFRRTP
jgi:8-oxo-dGTP pyrophosphatase MutT (NUDIX family)